MPNRDLSSNRFDDMTHRTAHTYIDLHIYNNTMYAEILLNINQVSVGKKQNELDM